MTVRRAHRGRLEPPRSAGRDPQLRVEFAGWLDRDEVDRRMAAADLLVLPSVWPEPFGLVGLEAGHRRLPVAAFDVGGISEWLRPGVNGHLAPGDPPTAQGLAEAIVACLRDRQTHDKLRDGAASVAAEFGLDEHIRALLETLRAAPPFQRPDSAATYINRERLIHFGTVVGTHLTVSLVKHAGTAVAQLDCIRTRAQVRAKTSIDF